MSAVEFDTEQHAAVVQTGVPDVGPGEALVSMTSAGICGSDITALKGNHPFRRPPLITGHEGGGRVVAVGSEDDQDWVGRLVAVEPQRACDRCEPCRRGLRHLCRNRLMLGMSSWPGTLAEFVVAPMDCLHHVDDNVEPRILALAEPLAVAHHALRRTTELAGRSVAVLGGGTIGALIAYLLGRSGAARVLVTDPRRRCREVCHRFGAEVLDPTAGNWVDDHVEDFDVVFVAAAIDQLVDDAVRVAVPQGTVVQVGLFGAPIRFDIASMQQDEKTITGSNIYSRDDFAAAVETLAAGAAVLAQMVDDPIDLRAAAEYLNRKVRGIPDESIKVLVAPSDALG